MRVAITGATGFVGGALARTLTASGDHVLRIGRGADNDIRWDALRDELDPRALSGVDAVVNLAGATIATRWTAAQTRAIRESRVRGTTALARAIAEAEPRPRVLVSGSAIGIYGAQAPGTVSETSPVGTDFLASVAREWESATELASRADVRVVCVRTGIVLSRDGGALAKMLPFFRLGLGGRVGDGRQWMSWIALHDLVRVIRFAMTEDLRGPVNAVAPNPVTNVEFTRALGSAIARPAVVPAPAFALRIAFGEMADATILASQRVEPAVLLRAGFEFAEPTLDGALRRALRP